MLDFNYNDLLKFGENTYFQNFFFKFYFYYNLVELLGGQKPFIRKIRFMSLPNLKKKKFYNFKILILTTLGKDERNFLNLAGYLFTLSKFSKALSSIFKQNSGFLIWTNCNFLNLKLINPHFFNSFADGKIYYLKKSSLNIKFGPFGSLRLLDFVKEKFLSFK